AAGPAGGRAQRQERSRGREDERGGRRGQDERADAWPGSSHREQEVDEGEPDGGGGEEERDRVAVEVGPGPRRKRGQPGRKRRQAPLAGQPPGQDARPGRGGGGS